MRRSLLVALIAAIGLSTACASRKGAAPSGSRNRDEISQAEIRERNFVDAYTAVETLHAPWLQTRGSDSFSSPTQVIVYMDDSRVGGIEALRSIATNGIAFIRHYDGLAATARWGIGHSQGAIYVSSRPRQ